MELHKNNDPALLALAERIGLCVEKMGSKRALANASLVSESQLFRYLNGEVPIPSDRIVAMAKAAHVNAGWLLTGEGDMLTGLTQTENRPPFRGNLLTQTSQLLDELLLEFEKPFSPRQRALALTFLYKAFRHEETVRNTEYKLTKLDLLRAVNYVAELRTEEELDILIQALNILEYKNDGNTFTKPEFDILRTWVNLVVRGTKGYYSSYPGQVYFERKSGGQLDPSAITELENLVTTAAKQTGKTQLDWLDLGCGNGRHLMHLAKHYSNISLKGVELSQLAFNMCAELMKSEKLPQNCVTQGDMRNLPFASESFDVVFANLSLYCIPYIPNSELGLEEALTEITRILRPKGLLHMSFPYGKWRDYSLSLQAIDDAMIKNIAAKYKLKIVSTSIEETEQQLFRLNHEKFITVVLQK